MIGQHGDLQSVGVLLIEKGVHGDISSACVSIDPSAMEAAPDCELIGVRIDLRVFSFIDTATGEICADFSDKIGVSDGLIIVTNRTEPGVMHLARPKHDLGCISHINSPSGVSSRTMHALDGESIA